MPTQEEMHQLVEALHKQGIEFSMRRIGERVYLDTDVRCLDWTILETVVHRLFFTGIEVNKNNYLTICFNR